MSVVNPDALSPVQKERYQKCYQTAEVLCKRYPQIEQFADQFMKDRYVRRGSLFSGLGGTLLHTILAALMFSVADAFINPTAASGSGQGSSAAPAAKPQPKPSPKPAAPQGPQGGGPMQPPAAPIQKPMDSTTKSVLQKWGHLPPSTPGQGGAAPNPLMQPNGQPMSKNALFPPKQPVQTVQPPAAPAGQPNQQQPAGEPAKPTWMPGDKPTTKAPPMEQNPEGMPKRQQDMFQPAGGGGNSEHPRWKAGDPKGRGGQFAPKPDSQKKDGDKGKPETVGSPAAPKADAGKTEQESQSSKSADPVKPPETPAVAEQPEDSQSAPKDAWDHLWDEVQSGKDTNTVGEPSEFHQVAKQVREGGGLQSKDDLRQMHADYQEARDLQHMLTPKDYKSLIDNMVGKHINKNKPSVAETVQPPAAPHKPADDSSIFSNPAHEARRKQQDEQKAKAAEEQANQKEEAARQKELEKQTSFEPEKLSDELKGRQGEKNLQAIAIEYEIDPEELRKLAQDEIDSEKEYHHTSEAAKKRIREATGYNAANIRRMANQGGKGADASTLGRGFDELADVDSQGTSGASNQNNVLAAAGVRNEEDLYNLAMEGSKKQKSFNDYDWLEKVAQRLQDMKDNPSMIKVDRPDGPVYNDDGEVVPFSRTAHLREIVEQYVRKYRRTAKTTHSAGVLVAELNEWL